MVGLITLTPAQVERILPERIAGKFIAVTMDDTCREFGACLKMQANEELVESNILRVFEEDISLDEKISRRLAQRLGMCIRALAMCACFNGSLDTPASRTLVDFGEMDFNDNEIMNAVINNKQITIAIMFIPDIEPPRFYGVARVKKDCGEIVDILTMSAIVRGEFALVGLGSKECQLNRIFGDS